METLRRFVLVFTFLAACVLAQGTADITIGPGPGSRTIGVNMNGVTGGTVTVTVDGTATVLDKNSGVEEFSVAVGVTIRIESSNGQWVEITNNGSTYSTQKGNNAPSDGGTGPDIDV